jgi:RarD protein
LAEGYLAVVVSMLIWGSVSIFARKAGQDPLVTVTYRVLLGALALGVLALFQRGGPKLTLRPRQWALMLVSGLALAITWLFFFKAVSATSVTNAVLSYYAAPVLVALTAPILLGERLESRTMLATALAFGGLFFMLYQPGQTLRAADVTGIGYGLIAACFYAAVTITGRWLADVPATRLVLIQTLTATVVLVPAMLLQGGRATLAISAPSMALLLVIGVIHTALALVLYFVGLRRVKVQHVGVLAYLDPVSAVLFAYLFLGEVPASTSLVGGALVLVGSALLLKRKASRNGLADGAI